MTNKSDEILSVWSELFVAHALSIKNIAKEIAPEAPLTLDEYDLLLVLSRSPHKKLRLSALAEAVVYTKSGISRITKRLAERKLLTIEHCPDDKRGALAVLAESGKAALNLTWKSYSKGILNNLSSCLTLEEAILLRKLLSKIVNHLQPNALVRIGKKVGSSFDLG